MTHDEIIELLLLSRETGMSCKRMTNYEHFKKDIDKLALAIARWGVVDGEVKRCCSISCRECAFNAGRRSCESIRIEWLDQEYKEPEIDW